MPVWKFRSIEEMPPPPALPPLDPNNLRSALSLMEVAYRLCPWRFPSGVHKFRSIEEANARRDEWESRMIRERRGSFRR
jgi:hypothetical protein